MAVTRSSDWQEINRKGLRYLRRLELDEQGLAVLPDEIEAAKRTALPPGTRLPVWLAGVQGLTRIQEATPADPAGMIYITRDILAGLNGQHIPFYYLILAETTQVRLFIGSMEDGRGSGATIRAAFNCYYPGIKLNPELESPGSHGGQGREHPGQRAALDRELNEGIRAFINACPHTGIITGIPTPSLGTRKGAETQVDRLIRGMYGTRWCLLVMADPLEEASLLEEQSELFKAKIQFNQEFEFRDPRDVQYAANEFNFENQLMSGYFLLEEMLYEGGWWVQSYICTPEPAAYQRIKGLVKGIYGGDLSRVDRIRVLDCPGAAPIASSFSPIVIPREPSRELGLGGSSRRSLKSHTLLSSAQLSALIHMPRVEAPGFFLHDSTTFDVSSHAPGAVKGIEIGEILDRGQPTGNFYRFPLSEFTKHCLLVGITGSGKTNTSKHLLRSLSEEHLPILVIEPAKREYRRMVQSLSPDQKLCVFTVGEESENSAPFRLNPLEIRPGVSVQAHIDLLKSVFNASFGMWTPLPQVLERAIHEVYREKGWDIIRGVNERAGTENGAWQAFAQPTLTDLFHTIADLVPRLGYDKEVERNVKTALETRINSLRIGAKGSMLDTRSSIPMEHLLSRPTVLELEGVGDDDEKAFIMGLVLISLYEYYRSATLPPGWMHITVIEEAHRLLSNTPAATDPEAANLKGKAVETFANMLSEVRAYGEGFIIAEQIPTKLAPDVIKNTGLKIMHRTVAGDDRQAMGGAMNLNEQQLRQVVSLGTGEAVVHGGGRYGDDNAILVRIPAVKDADSQEITAEAIHKNWESFVKEAGLEERFTPYPTCRSACGATNYRCADARPISEDPQVASAFAAYILTLVSGSFAKDREGLSELVRLLYPALDGAIRSRIVGTRLDAVQQRCILTHALYRYMEARGKQYGWEYAVILDRVRELLPTLLESAGGTPAGNQAVKGLLSFCKAYAGMCALQYEPYAGCSTACGKTPVCLFRRDMEPLVRDGVLDAIFTDVGPGDGQALVNACELAAGRALLYIQPEGSGGKGADEAVVRNAAFCYLVQKVNSNPANWPPQNRQAALDLLAASYGEAYRPLTALK